MVQKRQRKGRKIILAILLLIVVAIVATIVFVNLGIDDTGEQEDEFGIVSVPISEENLPENSEAILEDLAEQVVREKTVVQFEPNSEESEDVLSGVVVYADVANDKLNIGVNIDQYLESGTCELILRQNGKIVHQEVVEVMADVTTSACKDFDISLNDLVSGKANIEIYLNSDGKQGVIRGEAEI